MLIDVGGHIKRRGLGGHQGNSDNKLWEAARCLKASLVELRDGLVARPIEKVQVLPEPPLKEDCLAILGP